MEGAGVGGELLSLLTNGVGKFLEFKPVLLLTLEDSGEDSKLVLGLLLLLSCNSDADDAIAVHYPQNRPSCRLRKDSSSIRVLNLIQSLTYFLVNRVNACSVQE